MVLGLDGTMYVPEKQIWINALLYWHSTVSHVFPCAESFSNTTNNMEEIQDSCQRGRLAYSGK